MTRKTSGICRESKACSSPVPHAHPKRIAANVADKNIVYDRKLIDYMARKGYSALSVELISPIGACADTSELCIGFIRPRDLPAFQKKALRILPYDQGTLYLMSRGIETDDRIFLGLRSFFGAKDVTVKGMRAFSFKSRK